MPVADPATDEAAAAFIRPATGRPPCADHERCGWYRRQMGEKLVGRYIAESRPFPGQLIAAWMPVGAMDATDLEGRLRRHSRAAALRQARRAERLGHACRAFDPRERTTELAAINQSLTERNGRPMTAAYRRSAAELARDAETAVEFQPPVCSRHWDRWRGIFDPAERLVGYTRVRRNGNYALYAQWLGHGDHLGDGVMHLLHQQTAAWLIAGEDPAVLGVEHLVYAAWRSGGPGLQRWKRAAGFDPAWLVLAPEERGP